MSRPGHYYLFECATGGGRCFLGVRYCNLRKCPVCQGRVNRIRQVSESERLLDFRQRLAAARKE